MRLSPACDKMGRSARSSLLREILRTSDPLLLARAVALLEEARIASFPFDAHASAVNGYLPIIPSRLMVADADHEAARRLLRAAALPGAED